MSKGVQKTTLPKIRPSSATTFVNAMGIAHMGSERRRMRKRRVLKRSWSLEAQRRLWAMLKRKFTPEQESFWRVTEYVGPRTFKLVSG